MTSYADVHSDSPYPPPIPARSIAVGARQARPVTPSGTAGDAYRHAAGGTPVRPLQQGAVYEPSRLAMSTGRTMPAASPAGPPPAARALGGGGMSAGATATSPAQIGSGSTASPTGGPTQDSSTPASGGAHR